ncbi:MarR family transcriptional regulator [Azospirillum griseum]|uniref:MarR family transcriptional regulator n=1 Tax=Azospirillum griseum TaxID=2496639 RepID=A0A431VGW8_9PROT|nr:helix-turn-helix domain-containing protein [Azospirillum griseum]RTR20114.1 MarR family transcriptional regulator [Azospirillum griseum]
MRPYNELYRHWISVPALHAADIAVLSALYAHADDSGLCRATQGELAEELGQSRAWIHAVLKRLQEPSVALVSAHAHRGFRGFLYALTDADTNAPHSDIRRQPADSLSQATDFSCGSWNPESSSFSLAGGTRLEPFDWSPQTDDLQWAQVQRPDVEPERVTRKFVAWCRKAEKRNGYRPNDPGAMWRRWILRELVTPPDANPQPIPSFPVSARPSAHHDRNRRSSTDRSIDAGNGGLVPPWNGPELAARNHDTLTALRARLAGAA